MGSYFAFFENMCSLITRFVLQGLIYTWSRVLNILTPNLSTLAVPLNELRRRGGNHEIFQIRKEIERSRCSDTLWSQNKVSRTPIKQERNYAQIEKEALGIVYSVEKPKPFLYGRKFTVLIDHQPLARTFGSKVENPTTAAGRLIEGGLGWWHIRLINYKNAMGFANADGSITRSTRGTQCRDGRWSLCKVSKGILEKFAFISKTLGNSFSQF